MNRTLKVGNRELTLESNAGTTLFYKRVFRKDILKILINMDEDDSLETADRLMELCFIMSKQGEGTGISEMLSLTEIDFFEWACSFDTNAFTDADVMKEIVSIWQANNETTSEVKNA
jgi:hypothetical protein